MKRAQKLLEAASARLDLPGEIMAGLPKLELTGFSQLSVEHHKGILEYTQEAITVAVGIGRIRITGSRLASSLMTHTYLVVKGNLEHIELTAGGQHD